MPDKEEFNHILQQLDSLSVDLHDLAVDVAAGNINDKDETMVDTLGEFASAIALNLQALLREHDLL